MEEIRIRGARTHNLKNISLDLPRNKLIVITGLSGSGKSSLAFDTLYAEGVTSPKMINATVHAALYGRPYGSWAFEECIKYARQHSNVWFATRAEIADWVRTRARTKSDS